MPKKRKKIKAFEPCPDGKVEAHDCVMDSKLQAVADDYLTLACALTYHLKDAVTERGLGRIQKALEFALEVTA